MPDRRKADVEADVSKSMASLDSTGKTKGFRRLITRFAEKTSMQGVPYISSAKFWWAKLLWSILLIAAISAMVLHLWYLFNQYYSWPKQTTISLGFENLQFPEITICNTNRIHKGRLDSFSEANKLKDLVKALLPENLVPNQYDPNYDPYDKPPAPPTPPPQQQPSPPPPNKRRKRFVDNYKQLDPRNYKPNFKPNDQVLNNDEYDSPVDTTTELFKLFEELYMDINKEDRGRLGHNITDMLLSCTFNGRQCTADQFTLHQTSEYGNCWSITSNKFNVQNSGPGGGLSLIFYLESTEYLNGITTGFGTRLQIHEPKTFSYPAEEGMFIPASMETSFGLKKVDVDRLPQPHGNCDDGTSFLELYNKKYTRRACQTLCAVTEVIRNCSCFDNAYEEIAMARNSSLHVCRSASEMECLGGLLQKFARKEFTCPCYNPCSETVYEITASNRQWPNDDYALVLLQGVCDTNPAVCNTLRGNLADSRALNHNFLKLNIYYKDLNFENIVEKPDIEDFQFLSDVGGAVGLWIGLSILSLCEVLQLLVELFNYGVHKTIKECRRDRKKRRKAKKANKHNTNSVVTDDKSNGREKHSDDREIEKQWPNTQLGFGDKLSRNGYNYPQRSGHNYPSDENNQSDLGNLRRQNDSFYDHLRPRMDY